MPDIDNWRALREALDAGPTDKPWSLEPVEDRSIKHLCPVDADGLSILTVVTHDDTPFAAVYLDADAHYIAAAHPAAIRSLLDERDRLEKALALVQQHHATAWNRGHTIGMAAQEETARKALEAVKSDAWGNAQLTEALLAAEAERDRLAAEVEALRAFHDAFRDNCEGLFFSFGMPVVDLYNKAARKVDAAMKGKP